MSGGAQPWQSDMHLLGGSRFRVLDDVLHTAPVAWAAAIHRHLPDVNDLAWGRWWAATGEKPCTIEYVLDRTSGVDIRRTRTNVRVRLRRGVSDGVPVAELTAEDGRCDTEAVVAAICRRFSLPAPPPIAERTAEFHFG